MPNGVEPPKDVKDAVAKIYADNKNSVNATAKDLGVARTVITNVLANVNIREGTVSVLREKIKARKRS
jgi:DNA invertase Pin-like site-specific DNA recombinase